MRRVNSLVCTIFLVGFPLNVKANVFEHFSRGPFDASILSASHLGYYGRAPHGGRRVHLAHGQRRERADGFSAMASYYGGGPRKYEPNSHTANGEVFDQWDRTAAHRTLPLGTKLLVSYRGKSCVVRVNDRGPAAWTGRSLDLSRGAATELGLIHNGTGRVNVTVLGREG